MAAADSCHHRSRPKHCKSCATAVVVAAVAVVVNPRPYTFWRVPYNTYSIMGPKTLFQLLRPLHYSTLIDPCQSSRLDSGVPGMCGDQKVGSSEKHD